MTGCTAPNCSNSSQKGYKIYHFPSNQHRKAAWIEKVKKIATGLAEKKWEYSKYAGLCEVHFGENQFERFRQDGYRKLKPNAIPTLFPSLPRAKPTRKSVQVLRPVQLADLSGKEAISSEGEPRNDLPEVLDDSPSTEAAAAREQQQLQRVAQAAVAAVKFMESSKSRYEGVRDSTAMPFLAENTKVLRSSEETDNTATSITVWQSQYGSNVPSTTSAVSILSSKLPISKEASPCSTKANKRQRTLSDKKATATSRKNLEVKSIEKRKKLAVSCLKNPQVESNTKSRSFAVDNSKSLLESKTIESSQRVTSHPRSTETTKETDLDLVTAIFQDSNRTASGEDNVLKTDKNGETILERNEDGELENNSEVFIYMSNESTGLTNTEFTSTATSRSLGSENSRFEFSKNKKLVSSSNNKLASSIKFKSVCIKPERPSFASNNISLRAPVGKHLFLSDTVNRSEVDENNQTVVIGSGDHEPVYNNLESKMSGDNTEPQLGWNNESGVCSGSKPSFDRDNAHALQRNFEPNSEFLLNTETVSGRNSRSASTRLGQSLSGSERLVSPGTCHDPATATALAVLCRKVESLSAINATLVKSNRNLTRQNLKLRKEMQNKEKSFRTVFNPDQMRALGKDSTRGWNWSDQTIKNALLLKFSCGIAGYKELLKQHYPLPSLRTLQRRVTNAVQSDIEHEAQTNAMKEKTSKPVQRSPVMLENSFDENSTDTLPPLSSSTVPTKNHRNKFNDKDRLLAIELPPSIVDSLEVLPTQTIDDMSSAELASEELPALELPVVTSRYLPSTLTTSPNGSRCDGILSRDYQCETPGLVKKQLLLTNDTPAIPCEKEYLSDPYSSLPRLEEPAVIRKDNQTQGRVGPRMEESSDGDLCFTIEGHIEDTSRYDLDVSLSQDGFNEHTSSSVHSSMEPLRTNADRSVSSERCIFFDPPLQAQQQRPSSCPNLLHELESEDKNSDPLLSASLQPRSTFKTMQEGLFVSSCGKPIPGRYGDKNSLFHQHLQGYVSHVQSSDQLALKNHVAKNIFSSCLPTVKSISRAMSPSDKLSPPSSRTPSGTLQGGGKQQFSNESCLFTSPSNDFDSELSISVALDAKTPPPPNDERVVAIDIPYNDAGTMPQDYSRDKMGALCLQFPSDTSFTLDNSVDIRDIQQSTMEICNEMGHDSMDICSAIAQLNKASGSELLLLPPSSDLPQSMSLHTPFTTSAVLSVSSPPTHSSSAMGIVESRSLPRDQFVPLSRSPLLSSPRHRPSTLTSPVQLPVTKSPLIFPSVALQPPLPSVSLSSPVDPSRSLAVQIQPSLPGSYVSSLAQQPVPSTGAQLVAQSLPVSQATVSLASLLASRGSQLSLRSPYRLQPSAATPTPPPSVSFIQSTVSQPLGHSRSFVTGPQYLRTTQSALQFSNSSSLLQFSSIITSPSINSTPQTLELNTQSRSLEQSRLLSEQRDLHLLRELPIQLPNVFTQASRYPVTPHPMNSHHGSPLSCNAADPSPEISAACNPNPTHLFGNQSLELPATFEDTPQCIPTALSLPSVFTSDT